MNPNLEKLHPYPFERLGTLLEEVKPESNEPLIAWSVGEPRHKTASFLVDAMRDESIIRRGLSTYPPTKGLPELRESIAGFIEKRFGTSRLPNPDTEVLPVNGTREALFAIAQAVLSPDEPGYVLMPNPFYQIYEGAALLAGNRPWYLNCGEESGLLPDFSSVPDDIWRQCRLIYICSPGNPTGAVMQTEALKKLIQLADKYDFVIAADECYSEIYLDEMNPPPGLLQAASEMGNDDFRHCIAFNSLSKRSNLPGIRSGYVAGDADIISKFLLYRTYHGSAMPVHHQLVSELAWRDETHVVANRDLYREKFSRIKEILDPVWALEPPEGGFYFWAETPIPDEIFTQRLLQHANIKVLPGSYLSRQTPDGNPGQGHVRMALVATLDECVDAATRIVANWDKLSAT